jgi:hypothetical protein
MSETKILDRVRKLLAMANDQNGNDNERETALRQAHKLLTSYGLDMIDVEAHIKEKLDPRGRYNETGWSMMWTRQVRRSIGRLFMCDYYYYTKKISSTRQEFCFVGRESNAVTASYMSAYVIESILKEGRRLYKHNLRAGTRSFATGCANSLEARIDLIIKERVAEVKATSGKDLALLDLMKAESLANLEFMSKVNYRTRERRVSTVDSEAYSAGRAHGEKINLNIQMAAPTEAKRLK